MRRAARLLAVALLVCGCAERRPGDIVLITIDTLRADHLGIYGYERPTSPQLERLFHEGAVFERAYATSAYTSASTASLLTGALPQEHGVRLFDQIFPETVPLASELLPEAYQTAAFISTKILSDKGTGIASRFDHFDDEIAEHERVAGSLTDAALAWLRDGRDPERPLFLWVHYKDPHAPYAPPEGYRGRYRHEAPSGRPLKRIPPYARDATATDPLDYVDRYDEEIAYTDAEVGRLLDGYAARSALDDALVLLTADHGESLLERYLWFVHAHQVFEEQVRVPLLLRGPGVVPGPRRGLVSGIDVLPTLLAFAGAPRPPDLVGIDLRAAAAVADDRVVFAESIHYLNGSQWRAAIQRDRKWTVMLRRDGELVRQRRVFDLRADPGEKEPQPWSDGATAGEQLLALARADPDPAGQPDAVERGGLVESNPALLKLLGYAE